MAPIHDAAERGDLQEVMRLIQEDPEVVHSSLVGGLDQGETALHVSSRMGHVEVASYLLDQGADINARNAVRMTPLHMACRGDLGMVELLVSRGADPAIEGIFNLTPLTVAAVGGHVAILRCLLTTRAITTIDTHDMAKMRTALWCAAYDGNMELVKLLVEAGANPMIAGANPMIANKEALMTPLAAAQQNGHHQCAELLQVSDQRAAGIDEAFSCAYCGITCFNRQEKSHNG